MKYQKLIDYAAHLRQETFKAFIEHGEAHLGGSFSMIESLIALYEEILTPSDKFILSNTRGLCVRQIKVELSLRVM